MNTPDDNKIYSIRKPAEQGDRSLGIQLPAFSLSSFIPTSPCLVPAATLIDYDRPHFARPPDGLDSYLGLHSHYVFAPTYRTSSACSDCRRSLSINVQHPWVFGHEPVISLCGLSRTRRNLVPFRGSPKYMFDQISIRPDALSSVKKKKSLRLFLPSF